MRLPAAAMALRAACSRMNIPDHTHTVTSLTLLNCIGDRRADFAKKLRLIMKEFFAVESFVRNFNAPITSVQRPDMRLLKVHIRIFASARKVIRTRAGMVCL